jgi:GntR family transcriptional regulator
MVDMVKQAVMALGCDPGSLTMTTSKYEMLAEKIRDQIRSGDLAPGDRLPSTSQLKADGWSQGTITWAMRVLRMEGWTRGQPGDGVFVHDHPPLDRTDSP